MNINLPHLLNETIKIAQRAGEFIRYESRRFDKSKIEEKGLNNLVSYVDKEAERMIVQTCQFNLPDAGFITEEGTETTLSDDYNWVIDPLDGTTNFIHGLPVYSVSIALLHKKEPVLGVVYEVNRDECFYAQKDGPAYLNRKEITVSKVDKFEEGLYITGFPYTQFENLDEFMKMIQVFLYQTHGLRRLGSAAADLAYVACGRSEGFFENNLNPWDVAAGAFIVQQAGGIVTDYSGGNDFIFGKSIAAGCQVHPEMLQKIREYQNHLQ